MMRTAAVAVALLLAVLLVLRERLHDRSPAVLLDVPDEIDRTPRDRIELPPGGLEPGHRLLDTLKNEKLQSPPYVALGIYAYRRFLILPKDERAAVRAGVEASVWTVERWLGALAARPPGFLCIGESHQDSYREFLARRFFTSYAVDVLYLEAVDGAVPWLALRSDLGERDVDLLRADHCRCHPGRGRAEPCGGDPGGRGDGLAARARRDAGAGVRDDSIYRNVAASYVPGKRHAAILGALHCTNARGGCSRSSGRRALRSPVRRSSISR